MQVDQAFTIFILLELMTCVNELHISQDFIISIDELTFQCHYILLVSFKEDLHSIGIFSCLDIPLHVILLVSLAEAYPLLLVQLKRQ